MQKDFHYYGIYVLARCAGFSEDDAYIIAYSSQYVDDSTESEPINVGDFVFDTVRTAHIGLKSYAWGVQKKVFIPFHFLPPVSLRNSTGKFSYVTKPGSNFAKRLLDEACRDNSNLKLYRIGIALHTFADTWAHQNFSGRRNAENDVEAIYLWKNKKWKHLFLENIYFDILPQIGHTEAVYYPDFPFQKWKYKTYKGRTIIRDNTEEFLKAARKILHRLTGVAKVSGEPALDWEGVKYRIRKLLKLENKDCEKRCQNWRKQFGKFFSSRIYNYDKTDWRKEALKARSASEYNWDTLPRENLRALKFSAKRDFFNSNWVRFHKAALLQRVFVLQNLM